MIHMALDFYSLFNTYNSASHKIAKHFFLGYYTSS